jgi:hypothetical protein
VKTDDLFSTRISRLRRLIIKRSMRRFLVVAFSLGLIFNSIALAVHKIGLFQWNGYSIYPLLVLIAVACSLFYVFRTRRSFLNELIELDARLELKDRVSTAYEYQQLGRRSVFVDMLMRQASHILGSIQESQIFPRQFSPAHLLIPVFTVIMVVLILADFGPSAPQHDRTGEKLKQIGMKIERYSKQKIQDTKKPDKKLRKDLYEKMEKLAKELQTQSMSKKKLLKSLGELRKEAETESTMLARHLEAELSLGDTSSTPMLRPLQKEKITQDDVNQVKKQLEELFDGKVPASVSQEMSNLDQALRLEEFLGEATDRVSSALQDEGDLLVAEKKKKSSEGEESDETSQESLSGQALVPLQSGKEGDTRERPPGEMQAKSGLKAPEDKDSPGNEDGPSTAGRGKADGKKRPPSELEGSKGPTLKVKGSSSPGDRFNAYVRSLPTITKSKLKEEEVMRQYQTELESVLNKEDIPLHYREYIKNYFLSIGLRKENDDDTR